MAMHGQLVVCHEPRSIIILILCIIVPKNGRKKKTLPVKTTEPNTSEKEIHRTFNDSN